MEFLAQLPKTEITKDGGVIKYLVTEGSFGEDEKLFDIYCRVRIKLELRREDGKIITGQQERNNTKTVNLYESNCHPGIIPAIFSMKPGEISWFRFSEEYYNATVYQDVPPGSKLYFRIHFVDFDFDKKAITPADWEPRVKAARERGAEYLKKKEYKKAQQVMSKSVEYIKNFPKDLEKSLTAEQKKSFDQIRVALLNNYALCLMKQGEHKKPIEWLDKVLKVDEANVKAIYRKALCLFEHNDLEAAEKLFEQVLKLDPQETDSKAKLEAIKRRNNVRQKNEAKAFRNIFNSDIWNQEEMKEEESKKLKEKLERKAKKAHVKDAHLEEDIGCNDFAGELQEGIILDPQDTWS